MKRLLVTPVAALLLAGCGDAHATKPVAPDGDASELRPALVTLQSSEASPASEASGAVIHSCVRLNPGGSAGRIRIVDGPEDCSWKESHLSWNQQGAPGEQGPPGADGAEGPPGPAGPPGPGITETYLRSVAHEVPANSPDALNVGCDPGDLLTGGGYNGGEAEMTVFNSAPRLGPSGLTWAVSVLNESNSSKLVSAFAVCAKVEA